MYKTILMTILTAGLMLNVSPSYGGHSHDHGSDATDKKETKHHGHHKAEEKASPEKSECEAPTTLLKKDKIEVNYVRARPGQKGQNSAVFMDIINGGDEKVIITGASCDAAEKTELHKTSFKEGVHKMKEVKKLTVKKGKTLTLKPGGLHIMLLNLKKELKMGDTLAVELTFEDGQKATVNATVKKCCQECH